MKEDIKIICIDSMEEIFGKEYLELIEGYRYSDSKEACSLLNNIRSHVGGGWVENCFCDVIERKRFIEEFNEWFENLKK